MPRLFLVLLLLVVVVVEVNIGLPPSDATSEIQAMLNAGNPVVLPANTVTNVTGLVIPANGGSIRGENASAVLHVTSNAPAINCVGAAFLNVSDLTITGTGANYTGYGTGPSDLGQHGIHASNCPSVRVRGVRFSNLSGNGIDYEYPAGSFGTAETSLFSNASVNNSYRGVYTHNFGEYANFENLQIRNNVIGVEVESGNNFFSNVHATYNSIGIKINGQANQNPAHGTFNGGAANHNTYDLVIVSCALGQTFNGMNFIADQSGSITSGSQGIAIYNSKGVTIANGQIGVNVALIAADPVSGSTTLNGANLLLNNYIRDDLTNFIAPVNGSGTTLLKKGNYNASGLVGWNN